MSSCGVVPGEIGYLCSITDICFGLIFGLQSATIDKLSISERRKYSSFRNVLLGISERRRRHDAVACEAGSL